MTTLGMIGLGRTGLPIAENLLARGHGVLDFLALWARDLGRLRANGDPTPAP